MHLYKSFANLDFDASHLSKKIDSMLLIPNTATTIGGLSRADGDSLRERETSKYVEWVNKVLLQSHKSLALDSIRIAFDLYSSDHDNEIDNWLRYAFARRVQRLELDLSGIFPFPPGSSRGAYSFLYGRRSEKPFDCTLLRTLSLNFVNINGQILEFFLQTCPFLESLRLNGSCKLTNLQVCGPSLALRHLEIWNCLLLQSIIVSDATNLVSLKISRAHMLVLRNAPSLVDVCVFGFSEHLTRDVTSSWLSCCLSKLKFLTLHRSDEVIKEKGQDNLPQLTNLRHFTLEAGAYADDSLIGFTSLIRASPNLEKFVLKLTWMKNYISLTERKLKKAASFPLQQLKVVQILGYYGRRSELELVHYFLKNAIMLEKLIIDPCYQPDVITSRTWEKVELEKTARIYAKKHLEGLIPSNIELVIQ